MAGEYGGAIYASGRVSFDNGTGFIESSGLVIRDNESVIFKNNSAGIAGGAIYTPDSCYSPIIANNQSVIFEDNVGGAIYAEDGLQIEGNKQVIFRGNDVAIDAGYLTLSTTADDDSFIYIYDSVRTSSGLYLNTENPVYGVVGGTANGTILFSGENALVTVGAACEAESGVVRLEKGARLTTAWGFYINGAEVIVGQHEKPHTVLDVTAMAYEEQTGVLTYDLDYNMSTTQPLVNVGQYVNLIADSIRIDDSGLNGNPASIPLLRLATTIGYNGKTYSFNDGVWSYTANKVTYTLPMDEILINDQLGHGAKLEWVDKTLYYTIDTDVWSDHVKGLGKDRTWRGDVLDWHDINKDFTIAGLVGDDRYNTKDAYHCWAASASNMIQYWQDKYAPLFQSDELSTARTSSQTQDDVYKIIRAALPEYKNVANLASVACSWWFNSSSRIIGSKSFEKSNQAYSWRGLGFSETNFSTHFLEGENDSLDNFCRLLEIAFDSDSAVGLSWLMTEKATGNTSRHAITIWSATRVGDECVIEYTDSDREVGATSKMILKEDPNIGVHVVSYYDGRDEGIAKGTHEMIVYALHTITSPDGMDELLEAYNNTKTLHWTGTADGSLWKASTDMIGDEHHLADVHDGWKKECKGGGKTIYAHAYFTPENASDSSFVFADSVNGVTVTNKDVYFGSDLNVGGVEVSGKGYRFGGKGILVASDGMTVSGSLVLLQNATIKNTPLTITGTLRLDNLTRLDAALQDCSSITLTSGTLWCAGMGITLTERDNSLFYTIDTKRSQMSNCTVGAEGTFGCYLNIGGATVHFDGFFAGVMNSQLHSEFYNLLAPGNTLNGELSDYAYKYALVNANITGNADEIAAQKISLSDSTLTVSQDGSDPAYLTVGSAGVMNAESAADITICETKGATVNAGETVLMTVPAEEVYLTQETSITTPELTVAEESTLTNEGAIDGKLVVEAFGTLGGSGNFGATTVYDSGRLMVGSSPGAPLYESLTMKSGSELIFCLDGSIPASAEKQGWGSGTHSVLHVTQPGGLVVENGTTVSVGCSLDFLNASPLGETQTLSLVQLSSAGSAELLNALQSGTQFMLAEADDSLSSLTEVGAHVHHAQWAQGENNTLQLSFIVSTCPQDALIWTNGSSDGEWNESSQNWETLSGTASLFADGRNVAFYKGGTVVLNDKVTVGDMVVSTAENLRWEGSGGIAGSGMLVKEGRGELVIASDNSDFSGSLQIHGGSVVAACTSSLGSGVVVLNGGSLEIAANGVGNAIMNVGDSTLSVSSGLTHQLTQSIYNTGVLTLVGRFDVSGLEAEATGQNMRVDAVGKVSKDGEGSGFLRTGDLAVTVAGNLGDPHTVDASGALVLYKGQAVTMDNGVGIIAGQLHYDQYLLTGNDSATVSGIVAQAGNQLQEIRMTGGSLTVNQACDVLNATAGTVLLKSSRLGGTMAGLTAVEVSGVSVIAGNNSHSGGTILRDGAVLSVGHAHALGNGSISNEGKGTISVNTGVSLALVQSISNSGTLSLSGVLDAGKMNLDIDVVGYVTLTGDKVELGTGFVDAGSYSVRIVDGGKTVNAGVSILHDDYRMRSELVLGEDGVARAGGGVDYSRFFLTGADAVSVSAVDAVSETKGSDLLNVTMDGGELEVDADITVEASGGSIVITDDSTLRGAIAHADITAAAGDYMSDISADVSGGSKVTVTGGEVTLSGANRYTGGTVISGGSLTAGSGTAFGTGEVELRGGVLELSRKPLENKLLAQGGIISGGSGFRGAVVVNGSVGLRGNLSARSMTINSGSVLTFNDSTISVSGSLTLGGSAVLNLNGSDFGDGDVLITFGSLIGSEDLLTVEYGVDSDKYGVEKKGNALILAWLEEPQPEETPEEEPLPEPEKPEVVVPTLDRESCDALVQSSWGVFTASHAFTDAIGGQRSAAGYVGGGRSVAWVSALGGMHRIDGTAAASGSDIDLYGAAVGMEHYMSASDAIGISVGRLSGDVNLRNSGRETEQDGTYIGVYGTNLLAAFDRNSRLSLRWSAVYGDTTTEGTVGQDEMCWKQDSVQLNARVEWTSQLDYKWSLNVFGGAEYFASDSAENKESGTLRGGRAEEEARVRMGSIQNLRGELGIGTRYTDGSTTLYGEVRYLNDMVRSNPYADINGLRGYGANPGRQGIGVTLGAQQGLGDGWSISASYSLEAMSEATMHFANIGAGLRF